MSLPAILGGTPVRPQGPAAWPPSDPKTVAALHRLAETGAWGQYLGRHGVTLRKRLAELHNVEHVQLCSSGTAAVALALRGVQVRPGDEVVVSAYDFKTNVACVRQAGAVPVLVDCRADDAQLEVSKVEAALSDKTRAILVSHLHGGAVDVRSLRQLAEDRGLPVIEDACQAVLAEVDGRPAGTWGVVSAISFGGSKTLTAGRGGAVITDDDTVAQRMRLYNEQGSELMPLSEMQCAVLIPQLDALPERKEKRRQAAAWLHEALTPLGLTPLVTQPAADYYKLAFFYEPERFAKLPREHFCDAMHAEGVTMSPGHAAIHSTVSRRTVRADFEYPHADRAGRQIVGLHHPILLEGETGWRDVSDAAAKILSHAEQLTSELSTPS